MEHINKKNLQMVYTAIMDGCMLSQPNICFKFFVLGVSWCKATQKQFKNIQNKTKNVQIYQKLVLFAILTSC